MIDQILKVRKFFEKAGSSTFNKARNIHGRCKYFPKLYNEDIMHDVMLMKDHPVPADIQA